VLDRLVVAASKLPSGVRLCIEEGYRPVALQRRLFDDYVSALRARLGPLPEELLLEEASRYVACADGVPPHATGGAVDVTLWSSGGQELDMGSTSDDTPLANGSRNYTSSNAVSRAARDHRAVLTDAMARAGFVNYPAEWWHWSYGDQYWAFQSSRPYAIYGVASVTGQVVASAAVVPEQDPSS
jgi:D-alanyl-D-alanine dipeptidase